MDLSCSALEREGVILLNLGCDYLSSLDGGKVVGLAVISMALDILVSSVGSSSPRYLESH